MIRRVFNANRGGGPPPPPLGVLINERKRVTEIRLAFFTLRGGRRLASFVKYLLNHRKDISLTRCCATDSRYGGDHCQSPLILLLLYCLSLARRAALYICSVYIDSRSMIPYSLLFFARLFFLSIYPVARQLSLQERISTVSRRNRIIRVRV